MKKKSKKNFEKKVRRLSKLKKIPYHFLTSVKNVIRKAYQELKENQTNGIIMLER